MSIKLSKAEIVKNINETTGIPASDILRIVNALFDEIKDGMKDGRIAELRGFGTFATKVRKGKESARNPKTGESCSVESHKVVKFYSGKELKESIWNVFPEE